MKPIPKLMLVSLQSSLPPLGLAYVASYLRKYGGFNSISILENNASDSIDEIVKRILKTKPDIIGISSVTPEFIKATQIAKDLKSLQPDIPVLIGGVHITSLPHTLPNYFDVAVLGEGEETMLELMKLYEQAGFVKDKLKNIKGIAFHDSNKVIINERRPLIEPLDKIPFPARDLIDMKKHTRPKFIFSNYRRRGTYMLSSRGCPYRCTFCYNPHMWQIGRFFSPKYVVAEIRELIEKFKVEAINIYDDLFIMNKERVRKIAELIKQEKINEEVEFFCLCRANLFDEEICRILKEMGVIGISFGFESGSEKILNYLKKGTVSVEQNKRAVQLCKKFGISCDASFIVGCPGETREDIIKTYDFIVEQDIPSPAVYILTPYPGTELWDSLKMRGVVNENMDWNKFKIDLCKDLKKERIIVADSIDLDELQTLVNILQEEMWRRQWTNYHFKLKDLFSTIYFDRFIDNPKKFLFDVSRLVYYKLRKLVM